MSKEVRKTRSTAVVTNADGEFVNFDVGNRYSMRQSTSLIERSIGRVPRVGESFLYTVTLETMDDELIETRKKINNDKSET